MKFFILLTFSLFIYSTYEISINSTKEHIKIFGKNFHINIRNVPFCNQYTIFFDNDQLGRMKQITTLNDQNILQILVMIDLNKIQISEEAIASIIDTFIQLTSYDDKHFLNLALMNGNETNFTNNELIIEVLKNNNYIIQETKNDNLIITSFEGTAPIAMNPYTIQLYPETERTIIDFHDHQLTIAPSFANIKKYIPEFAEFFAKYTKMFIIKNDGNEIGYTSIKTDKTQETEISTIAIHITTNLTTIQTLSILEALMQLFSTELKDKIVIIFSEPSLSNIMEQKEILPHEIYKSGSSRALITNNFFYKRMFNKMFEQYSYQQVRSLNADITITKKS